MLSRPNPSDQSNLRCGARARGLRIWAGALLLLMSHAAAGAADYPARSVFLVVAFTPGGPSDVLARILGRRLGEALGQPFVIDNKPGAGGNIAAEFVAHAPADGYTLLVGNNSILATNASLYKKLGYDAEKDFAPISLIGSQPNILVVRPDLPAKSVPELIALAKSRPGKLNFASSGYGAAAHLAGELFKTRAGIDIVHVPYKGAAPALQDVIAGQVDMMFATAASVIGHIQSGVVRALAVTTATRTALLPSVPTVAELGLPGFEAVTWHGLVAPAGVPAETIEVLNRALVKVLDDPEVREEMTALGVDVRSTSPDAFAAYIRDETKTWAAIIRAAGAKLD